MNIFILVWNYLKSKPLNTALNIILLSLGIAVITVLLLVNRQLNAKIEQNAKGIDLVVGAKGSPLQLILCNIFHVDFPTGNINLAEADRIARGRLVKKAIPLALGDSYEGYRIIGSTRDYVELYNGELATGDWWSSDLDVTIGATVHELTTLKVGDTFLSAHGLVSGGHAHEDQQFVVKGILGKTNTVLDNLILTSVESIWKVHEAHDGEEDHNHDVQDSLAAFSGLVPSAPAGDTTKEITSMLLQYRSPMAAIQLPRIINGQTNMQAASPAFETARLFSILGVGVDVLMAFAYVLVAISALSIFIALYNSLKERRYDLAIMRSMGASRRKVLMTILLEGSVLTMLGSVIGLLLGHGAVMILSNWEEMQKAGISGLVFYRQEWIILGGSLLLGILCAIIPSVQAYRTDISRVLAGEK
jgi:putative ABC transport system permease protein